VGCALAFVCALIPQANAATDTPIDIEGVGAAHGFGMAMDGVEGQARAGWSREQILDLFYPGTATGNASGSIRVGLETSGSPAVSVPSSGFVSDAPRGTSAGAGFPIQLPAGSRIELRAKGGGVTIVGGLPAKPAAKPAAKSSAKSAEGSVAMRAQEDDPPPPELIPTPPPPPDPEDPGGSQPILEPTPTPQPKDAPRPSADPLPQTSIERSIWVWGAGDPALVGVASTGRRYRGLMEIKAHAGELVVVNHVDLETYVAGIAEEKGQAWPAAGLEALAIAARSLGAATMGWYDKNQANGYDICPTANCQLYLGYDGEAPDMARATAATTGQIRTYNGRPIMAMYHGNGGGQTESYKRVVDNGTDPHPYLRSVKYPFAAPSRWKAKVTLGEIETALAAADIAIPGRIERIGVVERGESPRVLRVRLEGPEGVADVGGVAFAGALELRSTWFDVGSSDDAVTRVSSDVSAATIDASLGGRTYGSAATNPWAMWIVGALASLVLGLALHMRRRDPLP
jgi:SpoIID/LytB domain protein